MNSVEAPAKPWHLRGNWAPVVDELETGGLRVEGKIPSDINQYPKVTVSGPALSKLLRAVLASPLSIQ